MPGTVTAGQTVTATAVGFLPGEDVAFVFNSTPVALGTSTAGTDGIATLTFTVPDVESGDHTVTATGQTSGLVAASPTTLQVDTTDPTTATPTTPASPTSRLPDNYQLPATGGGGTGGTTGWALTALLAGLAMVLISQRRSLRTEGRRAPSSQR